MSEIKINVHTTFDFNLFSSPFLLSEQRDGRPLPRDRARVVDGTLFLEDLHQMDYGEYECVASNEVATLVTSTKIIVEGTRPHAPYNITATAAMFYVTLNWYPGYSGGPDFRQSYVVWYVSNCSHVTLYI